MQRVFAELDRILRGEATRLAELRDGEVQIELHVIAPLLTILAAIYGTFMGWYALVNRADPAWAQLFASSLKVPALYLLTLAVTFPSLYVFNALVGSRLHLASLLRLMVAALAVTVTVLASLGTIVGFFSLTTESYSFMVLFNVVCFSIGGALGLRFLLQTLGRLSLDAATEALPSPRVARPGLKPEPADDPRLTEGPLDDVAGVLGKNVRTVFRVWIVLFALVGGQMAWVLRPFIGNPALPFAWFRERESNFFEAVWGHLMNLLS